ncbi:hypothetical protein QEH56_23195 [Pelagicoccus enzymogenes]|nr:hypothetical protein [Pelagicoccus enzymogenes]
MASINLAGHSADEFELDSPVVLGGTIVCIFRFDHADLLGLIAMPVNFVSQSLKLSVFCCFLIALGAGVAEAALLRLEIDVRTAQNTLFLSDHSYDAAESLDEGDLFTVVADLYRSAELFERQDATLAFDYLDDGEGQKRFPLDCFKLFVAGSELGAENPIGGSLYTENYRVTSQILTGPSAYELDFSFDWRTGIGSLVLWGRYTDVDLYVNPVPSLRGDILGYRLESLSGGVVSVTDAVSSFFLLSLGLVSLTGWLGYSRRLR